MISETTMTRRKFLLVCGCATAALLSGCINDDRTSTGEGAAEATQAAPGTQSAPATNAPTAADPTAAPTAAPPTADPTAAPTSVATRCPKGLINDPYPGRCRLYTDSNGNAICDYSEV